MSFETECLGKMRFADGELRLMKRGETASVYDGARTEVEVWLEYEITGARAWRAKTVGELSSALTHQGVELVDEVIALDQSARSGSGWVGESDNHYPSDLCTLAWMFSAIGATGRPVDSVEFYSFLGDELGGDVRALMPQVRDSSLVYHVVRSFRPPYQIGRVEIDLSTGQFVAE